MPPLTFDPKDYKKLLNLLISLPALSTEAQRASLVTMAMLDKVRTQLDFSGAPDVAIPRLVETLRLYGYISPDQHALGRLLSTVAEKTGTENAEWLNGIIEKYLLMVPHIQQPDIADWINPINPKDVEEKIIGENTLRPVAFLQQGMLASRSVAYISVNESGKKWVGSGFLVGPRLLLTNHHVLPSADLLKTAIFRFNYQTDVSGEMEECQECQAIDNFYLGNPKLDYALVTLEEEFLSLNEIPPLCSTTPQINSRVNIIQHPAGLPKQVALQNNFVQYADSNRVQYITSTLPGSSGSPVYNDDWQVVAIHHAGGWLKENDSGPLYFRNEGINIRAIWNDWTDEVRKDVKIF